MLRRNVLIFHSGALGDFVLTWPVAMALARVCAQSRIFYVTAGEKGRLAERVLGVESRDVEGGWQHLFGDVAKVPDPVRRTLEGTQLVVNFVSGEADDWTKNVRAVSRGAEVVTLQPRPTPGEEGGHVTDFLLSQLESNRVLHAAVKQMIASLREKGAGTVRKGGGPVVVHPGSGSRDKCWPVERWVELIRRLGDDVRVVLGEVERERLSPAEVRALEAAAPVAWPPDYLSLLAEVAGARAFVGNDSGPGHLAGAVGTPTLVLFGPTDPDVWRPLGPHVLAIRNGLVESAEGIGKKLQDLLAPPPDGRQSIL